MTAWTEKAQGSANPTPSQTLAANRGYILFVSSGLSGSAAAPTSVTGFTLIDSVSTGNGNVNLSAWRHVGAQSGAITLTYATPPTNVRWKLLEASAVNLTGTNGSGMIRAANIVSGNSASTTPSLALAAIVGGNGVLGGLAYNHGAAGTITAGSGYAKVGADYSPGGSPANQLSAQWDETGTTTCGWTTVNASPKAMIALEMVPGVVSDPPTVDAGADQAVDAYDTVTLTGSASGGTPGYGHAWTVVSGGPGGLDIVNASSASASFTAPAGPEGYVLVLRDTVTDAAAQTGTDDVQVSVRAHPHYVRRSGTWHPKRLLTRRGGTWV